MTRHLQLLPAPEDREQPVEIIDGTAASRIVPVPASPGTLPLDLASELRVGEPVVWWNQKDEIDWRPVIWMGIAGVALLAVATAFAPELWRQPIMELLKLLIPAAAPAALLLAREWVSRCAVLVTDNSVIVIDFRGHVDRLGFRNIRRVRRDFLTGGVLLEGAQHRVRIPPDLAEDARAALASQTRHVLHGDQRPEDSVGWLP